MGRDIIVDAWYILQWDVIFYTPPPPGSDCRDCDCTRIETKATIPHLLWVVVVVVYRIGPPTQVSVYDYNAGVALVTGGMH